MLIRRKSDLELLKQLGRLLLLKVHDRVKDTVDRVKNEHVESTLELVSFRVHLLRRPLLGLGVEEVLTPELGHHLRLVHTELLGVTGSELTEREGPAVQTRTEGDGTLFRVHLRLTEHRVVVRGNHHVCRLDGTSKRLVKVFLVDLQLKKSTVHLVQTDHRLDTLTKGLAQHRFGLDTDTLDTVDDDKGTIRDTKGSSDFRREVNVTRRVDQVDQELIALSGLLDRRKLILVNGEIHRDGSRLDRDTTLLLVVTSVHETHVTSLGVGNNTGLRHQRVSQRRLAVVDVCNNTHVTNVGRVVHKTTNLIDGEVHHFWLSHEAQQRKSRRKFVWLGCASLRDTNSKVGLGTEEEKRSGPFLFLVCLR